MNFKIFYLVQPKEFREISDLSMKGKINVDNLMWSMMFLFGFSLNVTSKEDLSDCSSGLVSTQVLSSV